MNWGHDPLKKSPFLEMTNSSSQAQPPVQIRMSTPSNRAAGMVTVAEPGSRLCTATGRHSRTGGSCEKWRPRWEPNNRGVIEQLRTLSSSGFGYNDVTCFLSIAVTEIAKSGN